MNFITLQVRDSKLICSPNRIDVSFFIFLDEFSQPLKRKLLGQSEAFKFCGCGVVDWHCERYFPKSVCTFEISRGSMFFEYQAHMKRSSCKKFAGDRRYTFYMAFKMCLLEVLWRFFSSVRTNKNGKNYFKRRRAYRRSPLFHVFEVLFNVNQTIKSCDIDNDFENWKQITVVDNKVIAMFVCNVKYCSFEELSNSIGIELCNIYSSSKMFDVNYSFWCFVIIRKSNKLKF